jgi:hypothetical protein
MTSVFDEPNIAHRIPGCGGKGDRIRGEKVIYRAKLFRVAMNMHPTVGASVIRNWSITIFPEADGSSVRNENLQSRSSNCGLPGLLKISSDKRILVMTNAGTFLFYAVVGLQLKDSRNPQGCN